ncbi:response regulator [Christiangramia salexigens]|uniref:Response regulatory domain-containing protein n=1 Tax=Christiangramia salexigens TaxID=1913577 RepID=A0A1L3J1P9_9FLAO|nr:response regulator [Christiangramia salexigens]APG59038.1 hypothetical protein LPB144_00845 [Christiangramia salexigens]
MIEIILIDDDPIVNLINEKLFRIFDPKLEVTTYNSANTALEDIKKLEPPKDKEIFVFLDINMPEMTGWEFLDRIHFAELNFEPCFFILSSSIDPEEIQRANNYSLIESFIIKPLNRVKIKELFEKHSLLNNPIDN